MRARRSFYVVLAILPLLLAAALIEAAAQVFLFFRPSYDVLFLQPDRDLGWRQVPNLEWTWAGVHWFANDFSVDVKTNSHGFRDLERATRKPEGVERVALLGDSFVEEVQVPLEKTAGRLLEARLNAGRKDPERRYEVLNFGVSNYGVGQFLLAYENVASEFTPDYVFALVSVLTLNRSSMKFDLGQFDQTAGKRMWVRPTFRLADGDLIREPAADFDEFVRIQRELVASEFGGRRSRRRVTSFLGYQLRQLGLWPTAGPRATGKSLPLEQLEVEQMIELNLRLLEELGRETQMKGARLVIVDLSGFIPSPKPWPAALAEFCAEHELGYVPLGERLRATSRKGVKLRWAHDGHFNEAANEEFAAAMHDWLRENGPP